MSDDVCSICMDGYKDPRILACGHTLCLACLKSLAEKTKNKHELSCPLCRQVISIPNGSVGEILQNFFREERSLMKLDQCNVCKLEVKATECLMCDLCICSSCRLRHNCDADRMKAISVSDGSDDDDDDRMDDPRADVPFETRLSLGNIPTIYKARLISSFSVGINTQNDSGSINGLFPVSDTEVWAIPFSGPYVILFDIEGNIKERIYCGMGLIDVVVSPNGCLFVLSNSSNSVLKYIREKSSWVTFASTSEDKGQEMAVFPDNRVAVVTIEEKEDEDVVSGDTKSRIYIFSPEGQILNKFEFQQFKFHPYAVTVNGELNCLCVTDGHNRTVSFVLEDGSFLRQFSVKPNALINLFQERPSACFVPSGLCCDNTGHVIVCDVVSRLLYVLNFSGDLAGLIASPHPEGMGNPFVVGVSKGGILWVGDSVDSCLRVYKISKCVNYFDSRESND